MLREDRLDPRKVYLIDVGDSTKIGYSRDPKARLASLQTDTPTEATLTSVIRTNHAPQLEGSLHKLLDEHRLRPGAEWFDLPNRTHTALAEADALSPHTLELREKRYDPDDPRMYLNTTVLFTDEAFEDELKRQRELKQKYREKRNRRRRAEQARKLDRMFPETAGLYDPDRRGV